jgi:glycerophosphoryl diester phosphodiesterase
MGNASPRLIEIARGALVRLLLTDLVYKLLLFILITPLFTVLIRTLLWLGGQRVLSDVDIAYFFAGPFGWFCAILIGAVWLAIVALEQASLLAILAAQEQNSRPSVLNSLRFAASRAPAVLRVAGRLIVILLLAMAPIVAIALGVYLWMLGEHDINYYLQERPREFQIAVCVGIVLGIAFAGMLVRLFSSWFLALPLVLFDQVPPRQALQASKKLVTGHRTRIWFWIVGWFLAGLLANLASTVFIGTVGAVLIPKSANSLLLLAGQVGAMVLIATLSALALNVLSTIGFSLILFHGYRSWNPQAADAMRRPALAQASWEIWLPKITRVRLVMAGIIGFLLASLVGFWAINSLRLEDRVKVMAHRGASKVAPENSLAAIQAAIDAGADWVEIDVQETADGEVVVLHDSDLMKVARNPLKIWDATMEDLRQIDIGSSFEPKFSDQRVPTLRQVLALCKNKIGVMIELKYYGREQQLEQRVGEIVDQLAMSNQVMAMSLKPEGVRKMKELRPHWKCGVLMSVAVGGLNKLEADFFAVNGKFANRALVNRVHAMGKEIYVWTIDDPATMSMMMNRGVDGILTNRPEVTREVIQQRAQMNSSERLLTEIAALLGAEPKISEQ